MRINFGTFRTHTHKSNRARDFFLESLSLLKTFSLKKINFRDTYANSSLEPFLLETQIIVEEHFFFFKQQSEYFKKIVLPLETLVKQQKKEKRNSLSLSVRETHTVLFVFQCVVIVVCIQLDTVNQFINETIIFPVSRSTLLRVTYVCLLDGVCVCVWPLYDHQYLDTFL